MLWRTAPVDELIHELTSMDSRIRPRVPQEIAGTFRGIIHRIEEGYSMSWRTALALMPTSEAPIAGTDPFGLRSMRLCDN